MSERHGIGELTAQAVKFVLVGGVGFVVDVAVFNLLLLHPAAGVHGWAVAAKTVSLLLAIAVNWLGSRLWTFRAHRRADVAREAAEFFLASAVGGAVTVLCLGVSHYLLGFTSVAADNISANVVGLALGSAVRFVMYRAWVFRAGRGHRAQPGESGSRTVTETPSPGRFASATVPPASSASPATIGRPSPPPA